jgi:hypothetical protein
MRVLGSAKQMGKYTATTKDEAQRRIGTFYKAVPLESAQLARLNFNL